LNNLINQNWIFKLWNIFVPISRAVKVILAKEFNEKSNLKLNELILLTIYDASFVLAIIKLTQSIMYLIILKEKVRKRVES
jgi:hypothetical protein